MPSARQRGTPRLPTSARVSITHRRILIALAALGCGVSVYLTYVSERLYGDADFKSVCAINAFLDCDRVISSGFGSLGGIPLAWFGVWFYAVVVLLALRIEGQMQMGLRARTLLLVLLSALAVGLSAALAAISLLLLRTVCLLCLALYLVNAALLVASWMILRGSGETLATALRAERRGRLWRPRLTSAMLLLMALALAPPITSRLVWGRSRFCDLVDEVQRAGGRSIRLTIYSDVQCPHCRALDRVLRPIRDAPGVQIIERQYPLDPACNPRIKGRGHPGACLQARALICARAQGRYHQLSDQLYDHGPVDEAGLRRLATTAGLAEDQFAACLAAPENAHELEADMSAALSAGIHGTPAIIFDNGDRHLGRLEADDVSCLIAAGARAASSTPPR